MNTCFWFLPGSSFLAASSAILSSGPEQGQPGSSSTPARPANRWADSRPPTTTHTHTNAHIHTGYWLLKRKSQRDTESNHLPPYLWCWFRTRRRWRRCQSPRCLGGATPRAETPCGFPTPSTKKKKLFLKKSHDYNNTASVTYHETWTQHDSLTSSGMEQSQMFTALKRSCEVILIHDGKKISATYQQSVESIDQSERETVEERYLISRTKENEATNKSGANKK